MAKGEITIRCVGPPKLSITVLMDETGPVVKGGYGGWEIVDRPRRVSLTQWNGRQPYQMDVGIMFDGYRQDNEVEIEISRLERMALPYGKEPPVVEIKGSAVPHDDLKWVITNVTFGDALRRSNGRRVRQQVTISFTQYVASDRLQLKAAKNARQKAGR